MLHADVRHDYVRMQMGDLDTIAVDRVAQGFAALEDEARRALEREGFAADDAHLVRLIDLRYQSQQWDITIALPDGRWNPRSIRAAFETEHQRQYGHMQPDGAIEVTRQRVTATGRLPPLQSESLSSIAEAPISTHHRDVWLDAETGWMETPVYEGWNLRAGQSLDGPAIVDEVTTTVLVGPCDRLRVDAAGNFVIDTPARKAGTRQNGQAGANRGGMRST
jgi:N-methylhydantoinase A